MEERRKRFHKMPFTPLTMYFSIHPCLSIVIKFPSEKNIYGREQRELKIFSGLHCALRMVLGPTHPQPNSGGRNKAVG